MTDTKPKREQPWWKTTPLADMNPEQWESLCDHCAKCCLIKLQDDDDTDDKTVYYTDIACNLLAGDTCHCGDYANRATLMPDCLWLTPNNLEQLYWMPPSCAYRLIHEGRNLPAWHHLVSGDRNTIHESGQSIRKRFVYQRDVEEDAWEEHIVTWPLKLKLTVKPPRN